jgi:hypothetical protein
MKLLAIALLFAGCSSVTVHERRGTYYTDSTICVIDGMGYYHSIPCPTMDSVIVYYHPVANVKGWFAPRTYAMPPKPDGELCMWEHRGDTLTWYYMDWSKR